MTSAVPSLIRLSPSRMVIVRRGTLRRRAIVPAASGSVGATIAPSANAAAHGRSSIRACATTATVTAVAITSPIASSEIVRRSNLRSRRLAKKADEYSSGGRKTTSTRSGSSSDVGDHGQEAHDEPADHEHDRVGDIDRPRHPGQPGDGDQQADEDDLDAVHYVASKRMTPSSSCSRTSPRSSSRST